MRFYLFLIIATVATVGCRKNNERISPDPSESYLPMQVGNYWKMADHSYTEIKDTLRIEGDLFYKFYSLVGGDASSTQYLRIDENNNLIEKYPKYPGEHYTHTKFNHNIGETFWTSGKKDVNDHMVKVVQKSGDQIVFEYTFEYHVNLKGTRYTKTYQKGLGYIGYKEVRIGDKVYKF